MAFTHELIDLSRKPAEFLELSRAAGAPRGQVPLLEIEGDVIVESEVIVRRIATSFSTGVNLAPAGSSGQHVEAFIALWSGCVESAYYDVLRASSESKVGAATAGLLSALADVETALWARRMESR